MTNDFIQFLKKFAVIGAAVGIATGQAVTKFVDVLVSNTVQPILNKVLASKDAMPCSLDYFGGCVSNLFSGILTFVLTMLVVFLIVKFFIGRFMDTDELLKK